MDRFRDAAGARVAFAFTMPFSVFAIALVLASGIGGAPRLTPAEARQDPLERLPSPCDSDNPYLATTCFVNGRSFDDEPAVVAFRQGASEDEIIKLAKIRDVGSTYGVAYDAGRERLYVSAYHKRNARFGPAGTGGVYSIPLDGGRITTLLKVPDAGRDHHDKDNDYQPDERGRGYAGKTSLGDMDIDASADELYVMNLEQRSIYRFALADGSLLGTIDHGARGEDWADDARPFGLAVRDGWIYHGLVNSAVRSQDKKALVARVYASRPDGSEMQLVAQLDLGYERGAHHDGWNPWPRREDVSWTRNEFPQAMLTDIVFDHSGNMVLGFRDRHIDTGPSIIELYRRAPGDILRLDAAGEMRWSFDPNADEHYFEDHLAGVHDEIGMGGLAQLIGADVVASTVIDPFRTHREGTNVGSVSAGVEWFDNVAGTDLGRLELVYNAERHDGPQGKAIGLGDLELVCQKPPETPTTTPTATNGPTPTFSATPTPAPTSTPTKTPSLTPTSTETPTPGPIRVYLPFTSKDEHCPKDAFYTDVVLVLDRSTSMLRAVEPGGAPKNEAAIDAAMRFVGNLDFTPDWRGRHDQVAVVGFNDLAWIESDLSRDPAVALSALERIRGKTQEGTRLDLAFTWGQKPLDGPNRKPENRPVIIMLTDGLPNRVPFGPESPYPGSRRQEDSVLMAVDAVKATGSRVYTVGLGTPRDILPWLLIECASERWMYHYAPRPEELAGIYGQIAREFDSCDPRPAPTPCSPEFQHADVVLVLDMSTSMYRTTRTGRAKYEAAIAAARDFVAQLDLERDGWGRRDQVAVVGFNGEAWTSIGLGDDRGAIETAIDRLEDEIAEGTRLDLALSEGQAAFEIGPRLRPNTPVMILLTDGLPNQVPFGPGSPHPECDRQECTVLEIAAQVKQRGTRIYSIGLGVGDDVLRPLMENVATDPSMYYHAPDGEDLEGIYRQIAGRLSDCP